MRRKTSKSDIGHILFDAKRVVGAENLRAIGEIVILWNAIEAILDATLVYATMLPGELWTSIRSRISGLEAKTDLLKEALSSVLYFNERERALLADTLADFMALKVYRDSIVHVRLIKVSYKKVVAFAPEKRGARYEMLFSTKTLKAVVSRLKIFRREMRSLELLVSMRCMAISADRAQLTTGYDADDMRAIIEHKALSDWKSLRSNRERRRSLRSLPEFPIESAPEPSGTEQWQIRKRQAFEAQIEAARKPESWLLALRNARSFSQKQAKRR